MDEILKLQQELASVQQIDTKHQLSDRNCIELVEKLQSLNLVTLLYTRSGKEYLTPEYLIDQVTNLIHTHDGRINLTDIPDIINVSLSHIECIALPKILLDKSIHLIRGELISETYLKSIIDDINDYLKNQSTDGIDSLGNIAIRFNLPVETIKDCLLKYNEYLKAEINFNTGQITSKKAIKRLTAITKGKLTAITFSTVSLTDNLQQSVTLNMLQNHLISGRIEGNSKSSNSSTKIFIPAVLEKAALKSIISRFRIDGFLMIDEVKRRLYIGKGNINTVVQNNLGDDTVIMNKAIVSGELIERVATAVEEAVKGGSWVDVSTNLPPSFPIEDDLTHFVTLTAKRTAENMTENEIVKKEVIEIGQQSSVTDKVDESTDLKKKKTSKTKRRTKRRARQRIIEEIDEDEKRLPLSVIADKFIVAPSLLQVLKETVAFDAEEKAGIRAKNLEECLETVGNETTTIQTGKSRAVFADSNEEQMYEINGNNSTGGSTHKKGKGPSRTSTRGKDTDHYYRTKSLLKHIDDIDFPTIHEIVDDIILSNASCISLLRCDFFGENEVDQNDFEGSAGEELVRAYIEREFPEENVRELYTTKAVEAVAILQKEREEAIQRAERNMINLLLKAEVLNKSAEILPSDELITKSRQWVLKTVCLDTVCKVTEMVGRRNGVMITLEEDLNRFDKLEYIEEVTEKLTPLVKKMVDEMKDAMMAEGGEVPLVLEAYDKMVAILGLPERKLMDKNSELSITADLRSKLLQQVKDVNEEGADISRRELLKITCTGLLAKRNQGTIIEFDSADVENLVSALLGQEDFGHLEEDNVLLQVNKAIQKKGLEDTAVAIDSEDWKGEISAISGLFTEFP